jgi:hypothetical protein
MPDGDKDRVLVTCATMEERSAINPLAGTAHFRRADGTNENRMFFASDASEALKNSKIGVRRWKCLLLCLRQNHSLGGTHLPFQLVRVTQNLKKILADELPAAYGFVRRIALLTEAFIKRTSPQEIIFTRIYQTGGWSGGESPSGPGSRLATTLNIRAHLPKILRVYDVHILLDIPCGDFHWLHETDLGTIKYTGADIVKDLVDLNLSRYAGEHREFLQLDLLSDPLPPANAILCRDCLPHFPLRDIVRALRNIKRSGATYLMTSDYPTCEVNRDVPLGRFRPINFRRAPFGFPPPLCEIDDFDGLNIGKSLGSGGYPILR